MKTVLTVVLLSLAIGANAADSSTERVKFFSMCAATADVYRSVYAANSLEKITRQQTQYIDLYLLVASRLGQVYGVSQQEVLELKNKYGQEFSKQIKSDPAGWFAWSTGQQQQCIKSLQDPDAEEVLNT